MNKLFGKAHQGSRSVSGAMSDSPDEATVIWPPWLNSADARWNRKIVRLNSPGFLTHKVMRWNVVLGKFWARLACSNRKMNIRVTWEVLRLDSAAFLSLDSAQQNLHLDLWSPFSLFGLNTRGHEEVIDVSCSIRQDSPNVFLDHSLLFMIPCWILHTDRPGGVSSIPEPQQNGLFCCIENGNDKAKISRAAPVQPDPPLQVGCGVSMTVPFWESQILNEDLLRAPRYLGQSISAPSWLLSTLFRWPRRFYLNLFKFFEG